MKGYQEERVGPESNVYGAKGINIGDPIGLNRDETWQYRERCALPTPKRVSLIPE